jgi:uncharacterized protein
MTIKIAIIGAGISGLVCASLLHARAEITVFEAASHLGGHAHTVDVQHEGRSIAVDTGFIVYNTRNYPNFKRLIERLGVASQPTNMSFSVSCERTGLEYGGASIRALFAQPRNLLSPAHWGMLRDILRFGKQAPALVAGADESLTLDELVRTRGYGQRFIQHYLMPMGGAIWSASGESMKAFPARTFVEFFDNHGMLLPGTRPQWMTIRGGSREYVRRLVEPFKHRVRVATPVLRVIRVPEGVRVNSRGADGQLVDECFDECILACHSNQALAMLGDTTEAERRVLGAIGYQANETVLHRDIGQLPSRRSAWAAWNYRLPSKVDSRSPPGVTYNMEILQSLGTRVPLCVTLNRSTTIAPEKLLGRYDYDHPQFTADAIRAQRAWREISGLNRTHFCGAYWGYGFHEDGVRSALAVCEKFGVTL